MYVVNQDGNLCVKANSIEWLPEWDSEVKAVLKEICDRKYPRAYNYGTTEKCLAAIKAEQNEYTKDKVKGCAIYVNDKLFGFYINQSDGVDIFKSMIKCLSDNVKVYDLSSL